MHGAAIVGSTAFGTSIAVDVKAFQPCLTLYKASVPHRDAAGAHFSPGVKLPMRQRQSEAPFIGITIEALLRPCEIYPVRVQCGHGYVWEWCAVADEAKSAQCFDMFFDCLEDARKHGYEPHFLDRQQDIAVVPVSTAV
jgi:hypothetical protein